MLRVLSILSVLFLSALIVYGGSGVNAYFYCCKDCRTEGHCGVVEHNCCETHCSHIGDETAHMGHTYFVDYVPNHVNHACTQFIRDYHNKCGVDRFTFDWQTSQGSKMQLHPTVISLDNGLFPYMIRKIFAEAQFTSLSNKHKRSQKPPDLSKEDYFSLLNFLII